MRTIAAVYSNFSRMLLEDRIYEDPTISYTDICAALHVAPSDFDEYLKKEMGMNGSEILQSFQKLLTLQAITHTREIFK
ncbi:MAG: hypothetical protein IKZ60_05150 [Bacteroidales bacterium]|nr:hypothetical protein [Bacteroidales bacterium]